MRLVSNVDRFGLVLLRTRRRRGSQRRLGWLLIALFAGVCLFGLGWQLTHPVSPDPTDAAISARF